MKRRKKTLVVLAILCFAASGIAAETGFQNRPIINNVFMPTGSSLNRGEFMIGLGSIGFGISDRIQVGTNVLLWLLQVNNIDLKVAAIKNENLSVSAGFGLDHFNLKVFGADAGFTSYTPFVAVSPKVSEKLRIHFGARYAFFTGNKDIKDSELTSTVRGTSVFTGLEYSFSNKTKFLAEGGYDTTFNGVKLSGSVLFGWESFRLNIGVKYFKPENHVGFTMPVIGIWWRFGG